MMSMQMWGQQFWFARKTLYLHAQLISYIFSRKIHDTDPVLIKKIIKWRK